MVSAPSCFSQGKTVKLTVMATRKWTEHRFGELVKKERDRKDRKWTQRELADKLADKGINMHWTTIAKIEKGGERSVRIDEAAAFADVFGVSVDHLLGRRARPGADRDFALRQLTSPPTTRPGRRGSRCGTSPNQPRSWPLSTMTGRSPT